MITENRKLLENLFYLMAILVILFPLDGYTFYLDMLPRINSYEYPDLLYGKIFPIYGWSLPIDVLSPIIPTEIFQKLYLFVILFLSGYSMNTFVFKITTSNLASLYSGFLYMLNPFTYIKILTGQWYIFYAIFPLLLKVFIDFLENNDKKESIKIIFILTIVGFSIHFLIIAIIVMTIISLFWFNEHRNIRITKLFAISGILFIMLNSYWIIPVLTAKNTIVDNITDKDYEVYAPKGSLFEIAAMYGFWREGYIYAKDFIPEWQILYLIILSLTIIGFLAYYKDKKIGYIVKAIGIIGIIGFILASGIKGPFGDQMYWLFDNTILKGFRDSYKFVSMIVLAYAVLGGLGIEKLSRMKN